MIDPPFYWPDENPKDPRIYIPNIEFYITNVCNLACHNCNRYNNYNFSGWQDWKDYENIYEQWATKVRFQKVTILGGEPLLNPSICDWIRGINRLWGKTVEVLTNGTRLNQVIGLYDTLRSYRGNWIGVSVHNINELDRYFEEIKNFLKGPCEFWEGRSNSQTWGADYAFRDSNGIRLHVWVYDSFSNVSVHQNLTGKLTLHNSDPEEAHARCGFVQCHSHHFICGKLYKCGPVALMPEFDQQHTLDISEEDRALLNSYQPLTIDEFDQKGRQFISNIDKVIPQCKFCPTNFENANLIAFNKKKNAKGIFLSDI